MILKCHVKMMNPQKGLPILARDNHFYMVFDVDFVWFCKNRKFEQIWLIFQFFKMFLAHKLGHRKSDFAHTLHASSRILWLHFGCIFVSGGSKKGGKNEQKLSNINIIFFHIFIFYSSATRIPPGQAETSIRHKNLFFK